jgi:hypothetical protein
MIQEKYIQRAELAVNPLENIKRTGHEIPGMQDQKVKMRTL